MIWLEEKYITLLSPQLRNFKKNRLQLYSFSCPICGDSKKKQSKSRGYFYVHKKSRNHFSCKCHNCGISMRFETFLKSQNLALYNQFRAEKFENPTFFSSKIETQTQKKSAKPNSDWQSLLMPANESKDALFYLEERQIPKEKYSNIYFTNDINLLKPLFPNYNDTTFLAEPRLVLPILSQSQILLGVVTRAIRKSKLRYINLKTENEESLIYNLERIDLSKPVYVLEGAFDSMFFENAIAVDGAAFHKASSFLQKDKDVLIYDNQPRNIQLIKLMKNMVADNWRLVIWPESLKAKDINEMIVKDKLTIKQIETIIQENTYCGLQCEAALAAWRKR